MASEYTNWHLQLGLGSSAVVLPAATDGVVAFTVELRDRDGLEMGVIRLYSDVVSVEVDAMAASLFSTCCTVLAKAVTSRGAILAAAAAAVNVGELEEDVAADAVSIPTDVEAAA